MAAFYLEQAANDGNAYAQYLLGKLHLMGEVFPRMRTRPMNGSQRHRKAATLTPDFSLTAWTDRSRPLSCSLLQDCSTT